MSSVTITVRYTGLTYVARCRGHKATASCVYDPALAATALARKLGLEAGSVVRVEGDSDNLEFTANPERSQGSCSGVLNGRDARVGASQ